MKLFWQHLWDRTDVEAFKMIFFARSLILVSSEFDIFSCEPLRFEEYIAFREACSYSGMHSFLWRKLFLVEAIPFCGSPYF